MVLDWFDKRYPGLRRGLLKPFAVDVNPNFITAAALLVAFLAGASFYYGFFIAAAALVLLNGFLDVLDGEIARRWGSTARGDLLDHTADRAADIAIIVGIIAGGWISAHIGWAAIVVVLLVGYLGTEAQALTGRRLYAGLLTRSDRLVLIAATAAVAVLSPAVLEWGILALLLLSAATAGQRFALLWRGLKK